MHWCAELGNTLSNSGIARDNDKVSLWEYTTFVGSSGYQDSNSRPPVQKAHYGEFLCTLCFNLHMFCVFLSLCLFICNIFVLGYANIELLIQLFKLNNFVFPYKRIVIEYSFLNSNAKILQMNIYFSIQMQNNCKILLSVFFKNFAIWRK